MSNIANSFEQTSGLPPAYELPPALLDGDPEFAAGVDQTSLMIGPGNTLFEQHQVDASTTSLITEYINLYAAQGQSVHVLRVNQRELESHTAELAEKDPDSAASLESGLDVILVFAMQPGAPKQYSEQLQNFEMHKGVLIESLKGRSLPGDDYDGYI